MPDISGRALRAAAALAAATVAAVALAQDSPKPVRLDAQKRN